MGNTATSTFSHTVDYKGENQFLFCFMPRLYLIFNSAVLAAEDVKDSLLPGLNINPKNSFKVCFVVFQH